MSRARQGRPPLVKDPVTIEVRVERDDYALLSALPKSLSATVRELVVEKAKRLRAKANIS